MNIINDKVFQSELEKIIKTDIAPPQKLDYIEFEFQGITIRSFGILHGVTGGLNREYRDFIKKSIKEVEGFKIAEKGMKTLYKGCGIDKELEDWLVLSSADAFFMGLYLIADPRTLRMITIDPIIELLTKKDPFIKNNKKNLYDLGESPYFHYLPTTQRRELCNFPTSQKGLVKDIQSKIKWFRNIFPKKRELKIEHPAWRRILLLERFMHIPCRSIHMLYYATKYAKEHNHSLVNIFVGETHNSDMHYLATQKDEFQKLIKKEERGIFSKIVKRAEKFGGKLTLLLHLKLLYLKIRYMLFMVLGTLIPIVVLFVVLGRIN